MYKNSCPEQDGNGVKSNSNPINQNSLTPPMGFIASTLWYTRFLNIFNGNPSVNSDE